MLGFRDQVVHCHDELFVDFLESVCNIPREFGTNYLRGVFVFRVQYV